MTAGEAEGALADLRRRLDELASETIAGQSAAAAGTAQQLESLRARVARLETLPAEVERLAGASSVGQQATVDTLRGVIERLARNTESLQQATLDTLRAEMERMGAAVGERLAPLESLAGDVQGVYRELDRVVEMTTGRDADVARLRERAGPLEDAVAALRADLERARAEMGAASRSAMAAAAERMDGLATRLTDVEPVQLDIQNLRRELERVVEEVTVAQQAALSAAGEQFSAQARLRSLETLPATVEGLQREVIRLSRESAGARESAAARLAERTAPLEEALGEARRQLDDLSTTIAAVSSRLAAAEERLGALESLPADVQGVYRELDKVAEVTAGRASELARVVGPTGMLRTEIDGLRAEIARVAQEVGPEGQTESLSSRLAGLESLRADVDALGQEVDRVVQLSATHDAALAQVAGRASPVEAAVDDLRGRIEVVVEGSTERARALESLPAEVEAVRRELAGLADDVSGRSASLETAVGHLQARLDQLAEEMVSLRQGTLTQANRLVSSLAARVRPLESLPNEVERVAGALDRLADQVREAAETATATVFERTAPLEAGLAALRGELDGVAADVVAVQRANRAPPAFQLKALEKHVAQLGRRVGAAATGDAEGLASVAAQLADLAAKVQALEALPADVEGVYAALYQVAEEVKAARRDAALA